jgi:lipoprotein-anchoring transpeptidase ErfK/SrfK
MPRAPRVTARYNRDYVFGGRGEEAYPRNHVPYGGERPDQIVDSSRYRYPYLSIGGTRTFRGSPEPVRYDEIYDRYYDVDYRRFR